MKYSSIVLGCIVGCVLAASAFAARNVEQFKTTAGPLKITTVMHAGLVIEAGGQVVIVDPAQGSWDGIPQADLILITDIHGDHMNPSMIAKVKKSGGVVIAPAAVPTVEALANALEASDEYTSSHARWITDLALRVGTRLGLGPTALKRLELSMAYAIWSGVGTALAAAIGIAYFREPLTLFKMASLALVILGVVGLSLAARQTN